MQFLWILTNLESSSLVSDSFELELELELEESESFSGYPPSF